MQTVRQWLEQVGLPQYVEVFERNAVDLDLLYELTDVDLEKLGVHALGHRKKILKAIEGLRTGDATALPPRSPDSYTPKHLAEKILTSKAALEGERKQVTVLFADLKGSMELLADRDPEEARKILDPVLERMMDAVHQYEGTVNQVMGDGIMALFGAPLAHEDHAVRACYAALRMHASVRDAYRQALALATELGMRPLVAHCHFGRGRLHRQTEHRQQARETLTTATTMYCEMGMQFWLEQTEAELRALA